MDRRNIPFGDDKQQRKKKSPPKQHAQQQPMMLPDPRNIGTAAATPSAGAEFRSAAILPQSTTAFVSSGGAALKGLDQFGLRMRSSGELMDTKPVLKQDSAKPLPPPPPPGSTKLPSFDRPLYHHSASTGSSLPSFGATASPPAKTTTPSVHPLGLPLLEYQTSWDNPQLTAVPSYYPMERSNRILKLDEHPLEQILKDLSSCLRSLSIQTKYFDRPAGAALLTPELVEMYLYLWKGPSDNVVVVELQRRRGDSIVFHRYARHVLAAASGDFHRGNQHEFMWDATSTTFRTAERLLRSELEKQQRQMERERSNSPVVVGALEIVHSLLQKDRLDARVLGMESLVVLTDPRKSTMDICLLASQAVLLGGAVSNSPMFQSIQDFVLTVIQKKCMVDDEDILLDGMVVDYDSDDEDYWEVQQAPQPSHDKPPEYRDCLWKMGNLALTVLANAWENVLTFSGEPENTSAATVVSMVEQFHNRCMDLTETDILFSLLDEMANKPHKLLHNAAMASKCLRLLCQSSQAARERTLKLGGLERAQQCQEVGTALHAKLQQEAGLLADTLIRPDSGDNLSHTSVGGRKA